MVRNNDDPTHKGPSLDEEELKNRKGKKTLKNQRCVPLRRGPELRPTLAGGSPTAGAAYNHSVAGRGLGGEEEVRNKNQSVTF